MIEAIIGTVAGSLIGASSQRSAARAQQRSAAEATAEQRRQFDLTREDNAPWVAAGRNALAQLENPGANFMASPGYNFLRTEGMRDLERSAAARGGATAGNALRRLAEFGTGLAQQDYNNWWNRTAGLAGIGQAAQQQTNFLGANMANNVAGNTMAAGDARASGIVGVGNALTGGLSSVVDQWNYFRNGPGALTGVQTTARRVGNGLGDGLGYVIPTARRFG